MRGRVWAPACTPGQRLHTCLQAPNPPNVPGRPPRSPGALSRQPLMVPYTSHVCPDNSSFTRLSLNSPYANLSLFQKPGLGSQLPTRLPLGPHHDLSTAGQRSFHATLCYNVSPRTPPIRRRLPWGHLFKGLCTALGTSAQYDPRVPLSNATCPERFPLLHNQFQTQMPETRHLEEKQSNN